jgi:glycosyltransferase involved in cell wall biosynthesis
MSQPPRVAIVCDWLTGIGGAERVVLQLHKLYPEAPIFTSQYDPSKIDWFKDADVRTGWLQKLPSGLKKFLPPLRAWYFSHLDLSDYDLVLSSSGAEAKGVKTDPQAVHISYIHAPTHYYWIRYEQYLKHPGFGRFDWLARLGLRLLVGPMRRWDYQAAQRPTHLIANSNHTARMIAQYYKRQSTVIFPPVDTTRFAASKPLRRSGLVTVGRQAPYMRRDLAVAACGKLALPLTVIGNGPDHQKLVAMAGPDTRFMTGADDAAVAQALTGAAGFIFPAVEDFGISAVEALAAGTPVIAYRAGGALDTVVDGQTGLFFDEQTVDSLCAALQRFKPEQFDAATLKAAAAGFSTNVFITKMKDFIHDNH